MLAFMAANFQQLSPHYTVAGACQWWAVAIVMVFILLGVND